MTPEEARLYIRNFQKPKQLNYTGSSLNALSEQSAPTIPPRPISGSLPTASSLNPVASPQPLGPTNASALVPNVEGGLRPPFASTQKPFIEGEFTRVSTPLTPYQNTGASSSVPGKLPTNESVTAPSNTPPINSGLPIRSPSFGRAVSSTAAPLLMAGAGDSISGLLDIGWEGTKALLKGADNPYSTAYNQYVYDEAAAAGKKQTTPRPEQTYTPKEYAVQGPSRKSDEDMLSKISNLTRKVGEYLVPSDSTFGFKADPKAMAKPNESIPAYMGRRIGEAFTDTVQPMTSAIATAVPVAREFVSNLTGNTPAPASTQPPAGKPNTTGLPVGNSGFTSVDDNIPGRPGSYQRTYSDSKGNVVASGIPTAQTRGGFVGASTDAEAARNLQDRFAQDQAASVMAANYNRQAEALKDLRAAQMGIPRSALEPGANTQPEIPSYNPFSRPGDSFGDDVIRRNALERELNDPTKTRKEKEGIVEAFKLEAMANQPSSQQQRATSPYEEQRFLLAQQQANRQQVMDENRLKIDAANLQNNQAKTALEQKQYDDKSREDFINKTLFTAKDAPTAQLAATAWEISKATGVPPDVVASIADEEAKQYDWKNGPPKDMKAFNERVAAIVTAKYKGGQ